MLRKRQRISYKQMSDINVTPFVDVMLVLLIVFMVTAPLLNVGVPVDLPDSKAKALADKSEPVVLSISAQGHLYIQKSPTPLKKLGERLMAITQRNTQTTIYVRADKKINYGIVMQVIGELNGYGFNKISLVTNLVRDTK